jgi:hypothetical protein
VRQRFPVYLALSLDIYGRDFLIPIFFLLDQELFGTFLKDILGLVIDGFVVSSVSRNHEVHRIIGIRQSDEQIHDDILTQEIYGRR